MANASFKDVMLKAVEDFNAIQDAISEKGNVPRVDGETTKVPLSSTSVYIKTEYLDDEIRKYLTYPQGSLEINTINPYDSDEDYYNVDVADEVSDDVSVSRTSYESVKIPKGSVNITSELSKEGLVGTYDSETGVITLSGDASANLEVVKGWINNSTQKTIKLTLTGSIPTEEKTVTKSGDVLPSDGKLLSKVSVGQGSISIKPTINSFISTDNILESDKPSGDYYTISSTASASTKDITPGWITSNEVTYDTAQTIERYISKSNADSSVVDLINPEVTIDGTSNGMTILENGTSDYYITLSGDVKNGSVKAKTTTSKGYTAGETITSDAENIETNVEGNGKKIYIKQGSVSSQAQITSTSIESSSGLVLTTDSTEFNGSEYYTLTPKAKASSTMSFEEGYIASKGTESASDIVSGSSYFIQKSSNSGAEGYTTKPQAVDGETPIALGAQQKTTISPGYYPKERVIYSISANEGTYASDFTLDVQSISLNSDGSDIVIGNNLIDGKYQVTANNLSVKATLSAKESGFFTSGEATDEDIDSINVGSIDKSELSYELSDLEGSDIVGSTEISIPTDSESISGIEVVNTKPSGYYVAVNASTTGNTTISAKANISTSEGYTHGETQDNITKTKDISVNSNKTSYIKIPSATCTISGGDLIPTESNASASNKGLAKTTLDNDNYVKVEFTRSAIKDAHTQGYVEAKDESISIEELIKEVRIASSNGETSIVNVNDVGLEITGESSWDDSTGEVTHGSRSAEKNISYDLGENSKLNFSVKDSYMLGNISVEVNGGNATASVGSNVSGDTIDLATQALYQRMLGFSYDKSALE